MKNSKPFQDGTSTIGHVCIALMLAGLFILCQVSCGDDDVDYGRCRWACDKNFGFNDDLNREACAKRACDDSPSCEYLWQPPEWSQEEYPGMDIDGYIDVSCY